MSHELTVVMPALNESGNIERALNNVLLAFRELKIRGEVIVVDDGSSDSTSAIAESVATRVQAQEWSRSLCDVRILRQEKTRGIGSAFWRGVQSAKGEVVVMLPGDGENDAAEILRYLPLLRDVDIVVPFVFNPGQRVWLRRVTSGLYRLIVHKTFGVFLTYMNGTVLYRRAVLQGWKPLSAGFFYQTEILVQSLRAGYLYAEVPVGLRTRGTGRSRAISPKSLWRLMRDYLRLWVQILVKDPTLLDPGSISYERRRQFSSIGKEAELRTRSPLV